MSVLRRLLASRARIRTVPQSVLETRVLRAFSRAGLPAPELQYPIRDGSRLIAVVDFAFPDAKLAIEADGYRWHSGRAKWEKDLGRRNALTALGWQVINVTSRSLERGSVKLVETVEAALARSLAAANRTRPPPRP